MPCCPALSSLYCIVIVSLNEINGDGDVFLQVLWTDDANKLVIIMLVSRGCR